MAHVCASNKKSDPKTHENLGWTAVKQHWRKMACAMLFDGRHNQAILYGIHSRKQINTAIANGPSEDACSIHNAAFPKLIMLVYRR